MTPLARLAHLRATDATAEQWRALAADLAEYLDDEEVTPRARAEYGQAAAEACERARDLERQIRSGGGPLREIDTGHVDTSESNCY